MLHYFIRHASTEGLQDYFNQKCPFLADIDLSLSRTDIIEHIKSKLALLPLEEQVKFHADVERITYMTDDIGQAALFAVVDQAVKLTAMDCDLERSRWMYVYQPEKFRHAEDIRYVDHYRHGRSWNGYQIKPGLLIDGSKVALNAFKTELKSIFTLSDKVKIDLFQRFLPDEDGFNHRVVQVMIYQEGFPGSYLEFEGDDELVTRMRCPVSEHSIVYNEATGTLETIAAKREQRDGIATAFVKHLLKTEVPMQKISLCHFDLTPLKFTSTLEYDETDGIESVQLVMLKFQHADSGMRIQLELPAKSHLNLHKWTRQTLKQDSPLLLEDFMLVQAKLHIRFRSQSGARCSKILSFKLAVPNGCDLRGRTSRERLITEKYLKRWGLLKEL